MLAVLAALLACGCGKEKEAAPAAPRPARPAGPAAPWSWQGPNAIDLSSPRGENAVAPLRPSDPQPVDESRSAELAAFRARLANPASFAAGGGDGGSADYTYDHFQLKGLAWSRACLPNCYEKRGGTFTYGDDEDRRRLAREELAAVAGEVVDHWCSGTFCGALRRLANNVLMEYGVDFSLPMAANPVCLRAVLCRRSDEPTCYSIRKAYPAGFRPCSL